MYIVRDHIVILVKSEPERHELQGGQQFTFNIKELYLYVYPWATVLVYIIPLSVSFPHPQSFPAMPKICHELFIYEKWQIDSTLLLPLPPQNSLGDT